MTTADNPFEGADIVSRYSRAQAIADGELVDVSAAAKEAGIKFPVALTRAAFEQCVALPNDYDGPQDEAGRLWDVLWMARCAMAALARKGDDRDVLLYDVLVVNPRTKRQEKKRLKSHCGPGDTAAPIITLMLPDED